MKEQKKAARIAINDDLLDTVAGGNVDIPDNPTFEQCSICGTWVLITKSNTMSDHQKTKECKSFLGG